MATETGERTSRRQIVLIGAVVAVVAVAFAVWFLLIRDTSAASVDSQEAAEAREQALDAAADDAEVDDSEVDQADTTEPAGNADGIEGTWTIDTSIGTFNDACLSDVCDATFVGFRINEELARIGAKTVVGRSPGVSGTLEIAGTAITSVDVLIDMSQLITDDNRRTSSIRRQAIETNAFPEASFALTSPIELGSLPGDGESLSIEATGDFTIHGVTRTETISLTAELSGDVIVVFGQLGPILLADYNIDKPEAAIVLSVEDNAIMEFQLFFTR